MQITRFTSLTEQQFLGCASAFVDTLSGELNSAAMFLRKVEDQPKGAAFAYEMSLDRHRYAALTVLDRWAALVHAFGAHLQAGRHQGMADNAPARVASAGTILNHTNHLIDGAERCSGAVVEACLLAFQSVAAIFQEERRAAEQALQLGPMLPEEFKEARGIFLRDLAVR